MHTTATAQTTWILPTKYLAQPDSVLIFTPQHYTPAQHYPLVYLLHGYSENYLQWSRTTDLQALSNRYNAIIVCPEGGVTYYVNAAARNGAAYEDFFFKDLVPAVHAAYTIDTNNIFISGLSMGGYGALRYFILHPDYFNTAASTSGALQPAFSFYQQVSQHFWQSNRLTNDMTLALGQPGHTNWQEYRITTLLQQHPLHRPFLIDCGSADILLPDTQALQALATQLQLPATCITQPGDHNTAYWHTAIEYHFLYFQQHLR
ncbi:esterase [Chitinophaga costaii]|nr:esterase [Chitinophaga costaii]